MPSDAAARLGGLKDKAIQAILLDLRGRGLAPKTINSPFQAGSGLPHVAVRRAHPPTREQVEYLFSLPEGPPRIAARDRAIMRLFVDSGLRPGQASRLLVEDFRWNHSQCELAIGTPERRTHSVYLNSDTGIAIGDYLRSPGLSRGPLFRAVDPRQRDRLANYGMSGQGFCHLLNRYLRLLPGALRETTLADGSRRLTRMFSPESLRITAVNQLATEGVPLSEIQGLLGHRHLGTTRAYLRSGTALEMRHQPAGTFC